MTWHDQPWIDEVISETQKAADRVGLVLGDWKSTQGYCVMTRLHNDWALLFHEDGGQCVSPS